MLRGSKQGSCQQCMWDTHRMLSRSPAAIDRDARSGERPRIVPTQVPHERAHLHSGHRSGVCCSCPRSVHCGARGCNTLTRSSARSRLRRQSVLSARKVCRAHLVDADKFFGRLVRQKYLLDNLVLHRCACQVTLAVVAEVSKLVVGGMQVWCSTSCARKQSAP